VTNNLSCKVFYQTLEVGVISAVRPALAKPLHCSEVVELLLEPTPSQSEVVGFSHISQTDYIRVIHGQLVVVILHNRKLYYFPLDASSNQLLVILPRTWHTLINTNKSTTHLYNAFVRNKPPHQNDYRPIKLNHFNYDWSMVRLALETNKICS
jgi:hypothetical protein